MFSVCRTSNPVRSLQPYVDTKVQVQVLRYIYLWLYSPCGPWPLFQFLNPYTVDRTCSGNQLVARPLPTHRTTQTQNKRTDIHASSWIRTNDPSVRVGEDCSCLDRAATVMTLFKIYNIWKHMLIVRLFS
jgi:hypothetical protein